jgi:uroporphyrin-III C-methyltransferase/precorrin-2 dehydrogenase/sirohydrochlorin ferrochelatase
MIFGRAGEEIESLEREGISVDVIPGITAASAMAARLGVSLTHRDHAQSVRFITGHSRNGCLPENIDWNAIADPSVTTVFYMSGRTAAQIQAALTSAGMGGKTPATIVSAVTRHNEKLWIGTLAELAAAMDKTGVDEPVLIGIGSVFAKNRNMRRIGCPSTSNRMEASPSTLPDNSGTDCQGCQGFMPGLSPSGCLPPTSRAGCGFQAG